MRKNIALVLACLVSLVGGTTLSAQTYSVTTTPSTSLQDGCYVVETTSKGSTGLMTHDTSLSSRAFLIESGMTASSTISDKSYIWRLEANADGSISLYNLGTSTYFPADVTRNQNCTGSEKAKLMWNASDGTLYQTNYTYGTNEDKLYLHCNETSYLNFSYWNSNDAPGTGTCVTAAFYKVASYNVTLKYQGGLNETKVQANLTGDTYVYTVPTQYESFPVQSAECGGTTYAPGETITLTSAATISITLSDEAVQSETVEWVSGYGTVNDQASPFYYVGVRTPREAKKYQLSAITVTLCGGSRSTESYLAISANGTTTTGKIANAYILGVSNEKYQPTNTAGEKYTYTFNTPVELTGDKVYYLRWLSDNTPGNYTSVGQRIKVVNNTTYAPGVNLNGTKRTDLAPEYSATLTYDVADRNEYYTLLVNVSPAINCDFTWNKNTVSESTSATFSHFAADAISDNTLTVTPSNSAYTATTLTWDGASNDTITVNLGLDIFSTTYGEKWLRVTSSENSAYVWDAVNNGGSYRPMTNAADVSSDSQVWCFVGTPDAFKIYNRQLGETQALTTSGEEVYSGAYADFTDAASAQTWKLGTLYADATTSDGTAVTSPGYTFCPADVTSSLGLNMYGGPGNRYLRYYAAGASNAGSHWQLADASVAITFTVDGLESIPDYHPYVANVACSEGAIQIKDTNFNTGNFSRTLYVPRSGKLTLSNTAVGTGYTFKGFSLNGGALTSSISADKTATMNITASYEESNPGVRYIYFDDSSRDAIGVPYRIPAIVQAPNGDILAFNDRRYSGGDIGSGHLDVVGRISKDNGKTWGEDNVWFDGDNSCGYGDPAVVCDRESNKVFLLSCSGRVMFPSGTLTNHQGIAYSYIEPNASGKWRLTASIGDLQEQFYQYIFQSSIRSMFVGSGKILQSRIVKKGDYYRLYAALLTKEESTGSNTNRVVYSDDFGRNWSCLGDYTVQAVGAGADEPKVEELPDGSIVISSRKSYGRYFNIFTFSDNSYYSGSWGTQVQSNSYSSEGGISFGSNACNGEIIMVKAVKVATGDTVTLALQSVPTGNAREKTAIYYKPLTTRAASWATPAVFAKGWNSPYYICDHSAAYSTMVQLQDGTIAVYQEENLFAGNYDMVYIPLSLETITGGEYRAAVDEDITAISAVNTDRKAEAKGVYDLQGRQLSRPTGKGIYIIGGKKTIVK